MNPRLIALGETATKSTMLNKSNSKEEGITLNSLLTKNGKLKGSQSVLNLKQ